MCKNCTFRVTAQVRADGRYTVNLMYYFYPYYLNVKKMTHLTEALFPIV